MFCSSCCVETSINCMSWVWATLWFSSKHVVMSPFWLVPRCHSLFLIFLGGISLFYTHLVPTPPRKKICQCLFILVHKLHLWTHLFSGQFLLLQSIPKLCCCFYYCYYYHYLGFLPSLSAVRTWNGILMACWRRYGNILIWLAYTQNLKGWILTMKIL